MTQTPTNHSVTQSRPHHGHFAAAPREGPSAADPGIVDTTLGPDGKPVYAHAGGKTPSTTLSRAMECPGRASRIAGRVADNTTLTDSVNY